MQPAQAQASAPQQQHEYGAPSQRGMPLLDPNRLVDAVTAAAARQRRQRQQQQQLTESGILDVALVGSMAGFRSGAFSGSQLARLASDIAALLATEPPGRRLPDGWGDALCLAAWQQAGEMETADVATLLSGLQGLQGEGLRPSGECMAALLQAAAEGFGRAGAPDVAGAVAGAAALGFRPHDAWLEAACARALELGMPTAFAPSDLAALASALATCGFRPPDAFVGSLASNDAASVLHLGGASSADAARLLWAACALQALPPALWLRACYSRILLDVETLDAQTLCDVFWAIGTLEVAQPPAPSDDAPAPWASPAPATRPPASFLRLLFAVSACHVRALDKVALVKMLWAAAVLRLRPPATWLLPLAERARQVLGSCRGGEGGRGGGSTSAGASAGSPPASARQSPGFEPLELVYVTRCGDMLYGLLAAEPHASGARGDSDTGEADDTPDEYERLGPPPSLALLVREANQALNIAATSSAEGLPAGWRQINVLFPPYASLAVESQAE